MAIFPEVTENEGVNETHFRVEGDNLTATARENGASYDIG